MKKLFFIIIVVFVAATVSCTSRSITDPHIMVQQPKLAQKKYQFVGYSSAKTCASRLFLGKIFGGTFARTTSYESPEIRLQKEMDEIDAQLNEEFQDYALKGSQAGMGWVMVRKYLIYPALHQVALYQAQYLGGIDVKDYNAYNIALYESIDRLDADVLLDQHITHEATGWIIKYDCVSLSGKAYKMTNP